MKNLFQCFTLILALALLSIFGCKKDLNTLQPSELQYDHQNGWGVNERTEGEQTVLGTQFKLPYKVEVIKLAYNNLYEPDISSLAPNYQYLRFRPQNTQDVKKMLESGIEFWDIPLDYKIISWGESYHDPNIPIGEFTYRYAVVKIGTPLPEVPYELLEQLALVPEDCAIAKEAFNLTNNEYDEPDEMEANPAIIDGKFDFKIDHDTKEGKSDGKGGECGCPIPDHKRKPSGCVQVFDNMLNQWEGVINVKVQTSKTHALGAIFHRQAETNGSGCWMINHKYHGKIHVWVKWANSTCDVKTMDGNVDLWGYSFPRRAYIGHFWGPNYNDIPIKFDFTNDIGSWNFRNWVASTVNNSVFEFGGFVSGQSISRTPPGNLKILITPWGEGNVGAAPMLDKMGIVQQFILFSTANSIFAGLFGVVGQVLLPPAVQLWLEVVAPDISLNLNNEGQVNSDDIRELFYHELAHAQHFSQVGSNYWLKNIGYTILHNGYGDGTDANAGRCSVIESWGFQIGPSAAHLRYGGNNSNIGNPFTNTYRSILERSLAWTTPVSSTGVLGVPHIPFAWEWDLQDNNGANPINEIENGLVTDRVTGFTNAQIFSTMTSDMESMTQMKAALLPLLPATTPVTAYNTLSTPYGF
jgi:hypothetical protein